MIKVERYFESEEKVFRGEKKIELKRIIATLRSSLSNSFVLNFKTNVAMEKVETFMEALSEIRKFKTFYCTSDA